MRILFRTVKIPFSVPNLKKFRLTNNTEIDTMLDNIAVIDFETDPFLYGRIPKPFACAYYDGNEMVNFWGDNCNHELASLIKSKNTTYIYAHNGGKFDFFYLLEYISPSIFMIGSRIAKCYINNCTLLDSFLILPLPLSAYKKDNIDYGIMERELRELPENKNKIIDYLEKDCIYLYEWIDKFINRFGRKMTIASTAFNQLKKTDYKIIKTSKFFDDDYRQYYYGGRTQAFNYGVFEDDYVIVDINSAYPYAMLNEHPSGSEFEIIKYFPTDEKCYFATIKAISYGALPFRVDNKLTFPTDNIPRIYHVTGFEIDAGLQNNKLTIIDIIEVRVPIETQNFKEYVNKFYNEKVSAKLTGDKDSELFSKLLLNSCYGRFGLNPRKYKKYCITDLGEIPPDLEKHMLTNDDLNGWTIEEDLDCDKTIWSKPDPGDTYYNVSVAASITGFVRAYLFDAICHSDNVIYCDTDSLVCKNYSGAVGNDIGQWKIEGNVKKAYIGGKKLYAFLLDNGKYKKASKGSRLTVNDIINIVENNNKIIWKNVAPSFSLTNGIRFIDREIKQVRT